MVVQDGSLNPAGHHHGPRLAAYLALGDHLLVEVVHHDLGLEPNGVLVPLHKAAQLLLRLLDVKFRIVFDGLDELIVALDRCVVGQHIQ